MRWIVRLALFSILGMALVFAFSPSASAAPLAEDETHIVQPGETISAVIQSKIRTAYGSTWNIWMPYWLGLYWAGGTENGFHGMPWNAATGRQMWPGLVGTPIIYGCIMLTNENAEILWEMAYIGMPVTIEY
jgi:lipoprotein-anchoring transpeptidase ErfK/SrfK